MPRSSEQWKRSPFLAYDCPYCGAKKGERCVPKTSRYYDPRYKKGPGPMSQVHGDRFNLWYHDGMRTRG